DDRLEHDGTRLGGRVEKGLASGRDEGDLLAVDRMRFAVVDGDLHVLHREAGDRAAFERLAHAFLHGGNERTGNRAALHLVDEAESLAARQRLDAQEHLAELSGAAALLLVPMMPF